MGTLFICTWAHAPNIYKYKEDTTQGVKKTSIPAYKTSTASKVISLPKTFKNFFETRDGQGNIVVSTEPLKRKFEDLWYENPCTPAQEFSNSIILQMAEQRMQHEKRKRDCELWCRKQRGKPHLFLVGNNRTASGIQYMDSLF